MAEENLERRAVFGCTRIAQLSQKMKRSIAQFFVKSVLLLAMAWTASTVAQTNAPAPALRPNVVFILVQDQRWDEFGYAGHPFVRTPHIDRLAREGVRFENAFVATPVSLPSRATFLTGQHSHKHGIRESGARNANSQPLLTWPEMLKQAGYTTAFVGEWDMASGADRRPGFDHWVALKNGGDYLNAELNIDGKNQAVNDYITDVLTDYAVDFLKRDYDRPLCLVVSHSAIGKDKSGEAIPAPRHKDLYAKQPIPLRPNFGVTAGKPPVLQKVLAPVSTAKSKPAIQEETVRNRLRALAAVDESVQRIYEILQDTRKLDNTLIIFSSDSGYFHGEHGLKGDAHLPYDEAVRIPLLMRLPPLVKPSRINHVVQNIDIAPTVLELAGAPAPTQLQGRSLVPLLGGTNVIWRNSVLIQHFPSSTGAPAGGVDDLGYQVIRTDAWKYIHYTNLDHADELYDLRVDPFELNNLFNNRAAQAPLMKLQGELVRLVSEAN